jgi:uncharacterized protein YehS (DUF1456 family)
VRRFEQDLPNEPQRRMRSLRYMLKANDQKMAEIIGLGRPAGAQRRLPAT